VVLGFTFEQRCERLTSASFVDIGSMIIVVLQDDVALAPFLGSNISCPFRSASGRILPHNIARMERLCLHLQPSDTHPDSFTPHSVNWVLVGRAEYCCKYVFLYATRMPCEEDYIFDPEKIRRIASELCNTQCNDRVAISILGVQCNNKNAPKFFGWGGYKEMKRRLVTHWEKWATSNSLTYRIEELSYCHMPSEKSWRVTRTWIPYLQELEVRK